MLLKNIKLTGFLLGLFVLVSCERAPEFSDVPKIEFNNVEFIFNAMGQDSLAISVNFEDGDGNLGISSEEKKKPPFHEKTYFSADPPYQKLYDVEKISPDQLLRIGDLDSLPEYNCSFYEIRSRTIKVGEKNETVTDTVYALPNPKNKNFFLTFLIKEDDGNFREFNFSEETCITANGSFTKLNSEDHDRPLQGTLTYFYRTLDFRTYFGNNTIKIKVQIMDRNENFSNIVESPEFTLDEILKI